MSFYILFYACAAIVVTETNDIELCLIRNRSPSSTIVLDEKSTPAARLAALKSQFHIMKTTGAELPIRADGEPVTRTRLLIGDSAASRETVIDEADFDPQEYLIPICPDTLFLIGRD